MSRRVLIVGGGIAGMSAAIVLHRMGWNAELIDLDSQWRVYGAGITITRPTMRAFRALGILDELLAVGFAGDGIAICGPDGSQMGKVEDPEMSGEPLPGSGGVMRPELHRILSGHVLEAGTKVRLGVTVVALEETGDEVRASFSDGAHGSYDLVIGADGVFSRVRSLIFPDAPKPEYTGQTVWRLFAPRPPEIVRRHFFLGGTGKLGLCPVSSTHLYLFLLENTPRRPIIPEEQLYLTLRDLLSEYAGPITALRQSLGPRSPIVVRPLEAFLLPPPWHKGRTVLIGDAAHPTTPQLASGAGIAVEDALVLGEEFERGASVLTALESFMHRRWERCRLVVENSIEIGRREQAGRPPTEQTILVEESLAKLAEPL
jgi:2-polyprenyl-6-methoxyphenol hydroxylase-like FAD-dependent oxidoreductase